MLFEDIGSAKFYMQPAYIEDNAKARLIAEEAMAMCPENPDELSSPGLGPLDGFNPWRHEVPSGVFRESYGTGSKSLGHG